MKRLLSVFVLLVAGTALSGCYYDPGYNYVRASGQRGDAYYGEGGGTRYVVPSYGYDTYYGGYYDCCYAPGVSVGIGSSWYGRSGYRRGDDYRYRRNYGHGDRRRQGHAGRDHSGGRHDTGSHGSEPRPSREQHRSAPRQGNPHRTSRPGRRDDGGRRD